MLFVDPVDLLPALLASPGEVGVLGGGGVLLLAEQLAEAEEAPGVEEAVSDRLPHGAARLLLVAAVGEEAAPGQLGYVGEGDVEVGVGVPQLHLAQAGAVDEQPALRQTHQLAPRRGVPAAVVVGADR